MGNSLTSDIDNDSLAGEEKSSRGSARCQTDGARLKIYLHEQCLTRYLTPSSFCHSWSFDCCSTSKKRRGYDFSLSTPFLSLFHSSFLLALERLPCVNIPGEPTLYFDAPAVWSYKGVELQAKCLTFRRGNEDHAFRMLVDQPANQVDLLECQLDRVEVLRGARHVS